MPSWNEVLLELQQSDRKNALDVVRRKYLNELANQRGRNVIAYYSGWLQKSGLAKTTINDDDKNGLMATVHKMDRSLCTTIGNVGRHNDRLFHTVYLYG